MTRVKDAVEAVDSRLSAIGGPLALGDERSASVENIALTAAGTDVPGAVLAQLLLADVDDILSRVDMTRDVDGRTCQVNRILEAYVRGMFLRAFWLGFEFGRDG